MITKTRKHVVSRRDLSSLVADGIVLRVLVYATYGFVALLLSGCDEDKTRQAKIVDELAASFETVKLPNELAIERVVLHAARQERATLFIHVDWAPMKFQQQRLAKFIVAYQQRHPKAPIAFHYLDCTNSPRYTSLKLLPGWKELYDDQVSLLGGWGELVWMKDGRVLEVDRIDHSKSTAELIDKTERLLGIGRH